MRVSARRLFPILLLASAITLLSTLPASGQVIALGNEFRVNSTLNVNKDVPRIAVAKGGTFQVVWQSPPLFTGIANVFVRRFSAAGAPLANDALVNDLPGSNENYPGIASLSSNGAFVVVWRTSIASTTANDGIAAKVYDSAGGSPGEFRVDTYTTGSNTARHAPAVGADSAGNFVVVWDQYFATNSIRGQRYNSSGTPLGGNFSVYSATTISNFFGPPSIGVADDGSFVVTWSAATAGTVSTFGYDIVGRRFSSSGAPLDPTFFAVNSYTTGHQKFSSVAMNSVGDFVVVWSSYPNTFNGPVRARLFSSSGAPGAEFQVSGPMTYVRDPSVTRFPGGSFVVTWTDPSSVLSSNDVKARLYSSSGVLQGAEFQVNTYTTYGQGRSSVSSDPLGNFTVVWVTDKSTDSSTVKEVDGQRYCGLPGVAVIPPAPITVTQTLCQ